MRVAVTGASGFVGGRVARALAARGYDVVSFGRRLRAALSDPPPGYRSWDLAHGPLDDVAADAVVHCAAHVGDWGKESTYRAVNIDGTCAVLTSFPHAARFVYVSSSSVYSDCVAKRQLREDSPVGNCAHSAYARTKAAAEQLVVTRCRGAIVLRPHIVYGPGDTTLLPRLLGARRFGRLPIPGDGTNHVSVTHVDNLIHAIDCALRSDARGVFNVSDGDVTTVDDLLCTVLDRLEIDSRIMYIPRSVAWNLAGALEAAWPIKTGQRGPMLTRYVVSQLSDEHTLDITRARDELGYAPAWTYRDGPLAM